MNYYTAVLIQCVILFCVLWGCMKSNEMLRNKIIKKCKDWVKEKGGEFISVEETYYRFEKKYEYKVTWIDKERHEHVMICINKGYIFGLKFEEIR